MKKLIAVFLCLTLLGCEPVPPSPKVYSAGDLVQLKSGGPVMTVEYDVHGVGAVHCEWLDNIGQPHHKVYYQPSIKKYQE